VFPALSWSPSTTAVAPSAPDADAGGLALTAGPNPFTPAAGAMTIRFAAPGEVVLDAYDVHGRHVARLYRGDATGGRSVAWRGTGDRGNVPAGVYWLRLSASGAARALRVVATR